MSFSYDTSLSASKDQLRFLLADTVNTATSPAIFQDEELTGLLNNVEAGLYQAAAVALRSRAASFIDKAIKYSVGADIRGSLSVDRKGLMKEIMALAKTFEDIAMAQPYEVFDRADFNVNWLGEDVSNYQGYTDTLDWTDIVCE